MRRNEIIWDALSLGLGVQSTGMAVMAGMDWIPRPDAVYYAELWNEGDEVYEYQAYITPILKNLGIEIQIVDAGNIFDHIMTWPTAERVSMIPVWFLNPNDGKRQPLRRQCTSDFKIQTIAKAIRKDLGVKRLKENSVRIWQGISIDEIKRAKKSSLYPDKAFRVNHYPFIGQFANVTYPHFRWESYSREKIMQKVFRDNGLRVPPKSSCFFCPFHELDMWERLYQKPHLWEKACVLDDSIRDYNTPNDSFQNGPFYLYEGLVPLRELDFEKERAKQRENPGLFGCDSGFCFM